MSLLLGLMKLKLNFTSIVAAKFTPKVRMCRYMSQKKLILIRGTISKVTNGQINNRRKVPTLHFCTQESDETGRHLAMSKSLFTHAFFHNLFNIHFIMN